MNFTLKVKESTTIFSIKNILRDRHGRMDELKICFKSFTEANEVKDDMLTLAGIKKLLHLCPFVFVIFHSPLLSVKRNYSLYLITFHQSVD
jgi:hypothetical protein